MMLSFNNKTHSNKTYNNNNSCNNILSNISNKIHNLLLINSSHNNNCSYNNSHIYREIINRLIILWEIKCLNNKLITSINDNMTLQTLLMMISMGRAIE